MGGSALIIREARKDDVKPLVAFCNKVWTQLGMPWEATLDRVLRMQEQEFRTIVLYDGKGMVAALTAHPIETDRGPGYEVPMFAVDQERPDRLKLLDAISMYACNVAMSEGRRVVSSPSLKAVPGPAYGKEFVGMESEDMGDSYRQTGDARDIIKAILARRPEWRTSL